MTGENNGSAVLMAMTTGIWTGTAAITSVQFAFAAGGENIVAGSTFYLYGIKNS